jgi:hypothetical protein
MKKPDHAVVINNYDEFRAEIQTFADGKYNFAIVIGRTGLGKTETVREIVGPHHLLFESRPSGWGFFRDLYRDRHATVVMDDVAPAFYRDSVCLSLLKQLTETHKTKTLHWPTGQTGEDREIPSTFTTESRVILLTNDWASVNEHVRAVEGRAQIIVFDPTPEEVHFEVGRRGWFHDEEVYDFLWNLRRFITRPDMRAYRLLAEQKAAGRPWTKRGLEMLIGNMKLQQIAELLQDDRFGSNNERAAAFEGLGLGVRSTFFRLLRDFRWYHAVDPAADPPKLRGTKANGSEISSGAVARASAPDRPAHGGDVRQRRSAHST